MGEIPYFGSSEKPKALPPDLMNEAFDLRMLEPIIAVGRGQGNH
jgi:hypothetical protein